MKQVQRIVIILMFSFVLVAVTIAYAAPSSDEDSPAAQRALNAVAMTDSWGASQEITGATSLQDDEFGYAVAIDGNTAVIGSRNGNTDDEGSAFVFVRTSGVWVEQAELKAGDAGLWDNFGAAVAIDGDTIIVGAFGDNDAGSNSGSAYIFVRSNGMWSEQEKLTAADAARVDLFGYAVAIDGDTAVIGAYGEDDSDDASIDYRGAVYVFTRTNESWTEAQKLIGDDVIDGAKFGNTVDIDGDVLIASAPGTNLSTGAVYTFIYSQTITDDMWIQQQKLTSSHNTNNRFGTSVAIDGQTAVISMLPSGGGTGAAHVYAYAADMWSVQKILTSTDSITSDFFGYSVDISENRVVVGAYINEDVGTDRGAAYIFSGSGSSWDDGQKLTAVDAENSDWFGRAVAIDGNSILIGAQSHDHAGSNRGSAYIYFSEYSVFLPTIIK